jgi:hypothetical protein
VSVTGGWDAVCALDTSQLNQLLFQCYLQDGPTSPAVPLRIVVQDQGASYTLVDAVLGPPELSFPAELSQDQVQLTMMLVRGSVVTFDANQQTIVTAVQLQPMQSQLTGNLQLASVTGGVTTRGSNIPCSAPGDVVIDLASNAWTPAIESIAGESEQATVLGAAIQTFFQYAATTYQLGTVATTSVPECLLPTKFAFVTAQAPGSTSDGCLQILIQTNGSGGTVAALASYPIAQGSSAALIISNQTMFSSDGVLPTVLKSSLDGIGATYMGVESNGTWSTVITGGMVNAGVIPANPTGPMPFTSGDYDSSSNPPPSQPVTVAFDNDSGTCTLGISNGGLSLTWSQQWYQYWAYFYAVGKWSTWDTLGAPMLAQLQWNGQPSIPANTTATIEFSDSSTQPSVSCTDSKFLQFVAGTLDYVDAFVTAFEPVLTNVLQNLQAVDISTFALGNLLFPSQSGFQMAFTSGSVPCDLQIQGQLPATIAVSPAQVTLAPGATQAFTATQSGTATTDVTWTASAGSITSDGLLSAPNGVAAVVVTAVSNASASVVGSALALVYPTPAQDALILTPASVWVGAGQTCTFQVTDASGTPVASTIASPAAGTVTPGFGGIGQWIYTAPETIAAVQPIILTATADADSSQTGSAAMQLTPSETVAVTPSATTASAGQTVSLSAVTETLDDLAWLVYPAGCGSISGDGLSATYTAPTAIASDQLVMIAAYGLGSQAMGVGLVGITLESTTGARAQRPAVCPDQAS